MRGRGEGRVYEIGAGGQIIVAAVVDAWAGVVVIVRDVVSGADCHHDGSKGGLVLVVVVLTGETVWGLQSSGCCGSKDKKNTYLLGVLASPPNPNSGYSTCSCSSNYDSFHRRHC